MVKGWGKTQLHAVCSTLSPHLHVELEVLPDHGRAEKVRLTTYLVSRPSGDFDPSADYTLEVPLGSSIEIHNPEGRVEIRGLQGAAEIESAGGSVSVTEVAGHLAVRSVGGDIEVIRPAGRVEASTITGRLLISSPTSSEIHGSTTQGKISYEGDFVRAGRCRLTSYSGDIDILYAKSASFELRAKSLRGKVVTDSELPRKPNRRSTPAPSSGNSFSGTRNAGSATVDATSFSGTIRVLSQGPKN